jgi:hypothetical protein
MLLKCEGADSFNDLRFFIAVLVSKGIPRETVIVLANRYCVGATPDVTALGADGKEYPTAFCFSGLA